ncbi:Histone-lysine N-methyltransferase SUVR3 [Zea mays]|uniref:Histone-lysine N-methyltransferase SUVR3 n=1 Tax=Zea mays TaxID=4577 RepID=A0A1D6EVL8_MAIZE|nr:Histone-lysine N-methyltransferase SUVR3 [Zea mays]
MLLWKLGLFWCASFRRNLRTDAITLDVLQMSLILFLTSQ